MELGLKFRVVQIPIDAGLQPVERGHQSLRHIAPAEFAVTAARVGKTGRRLGGARQ